MTVSEQFDVRVAGLRTARDEFRLQAHLFAADLKQDWAAVEARLEVIEYELSRFAKQAVGPMKTVEKAAHDLLEEGEAAIARVRERSVT